MNAKSSTIASGRRKLATMAATNNIPVMALTIKFFIDFLLCFDYPYRCHPLVWHYSLVVLSVQPQPPVACPVPLPCALLPHAAEPQAILPHDWSMGACRIFSPHPLRISPHALSVAEPIEHVLPYVR